MASYTSGVYIIGRPENERWKNIVKYAIVLIPAIICFTLINKYALNLPSQDDYDAILGFLIKYKNATGWDKLTVCLSQHNEHRILSSRIIYLLYDSLAGGINFRGIIFIGNIQLLIVFIIVVEFIKKALPKYWVLASLVMSLCLFDPNNWENIDSAMGSVQNYGIIFLFCTSLFFYNLPGKLFIMPALLLQVLCIYSSGNGIIGAGFIALSTLLLRDRWKIVAAVSSLLIFSPLYFFKYNYPLHPAEPIHFAGVLRYFFHLAGAHVYFETMTPAIVAGVVLLLVFFVFLPVTKGLQVRREAIPFICISGFVLASMATISLFRSNLGGPPYCSRYLIYPHFLFAITFIFLLMRLQRNIIIWPLSIIFVFCMIRTYQTNKAGGIFGLEFQSGQLKSNDYYYPDKNAGKVTADKACELKIYCIGKNR